MNRLRSRLALLATRCLADRIDLARWEVLAGRVLVAWCLWSSLPLMPAGFTAQPDPSGLGHWFDFTWLQDPALFKTALLAARIGLVCYAVGLASPAGLVAFLILDVSNGTLTASQGILGHGGNLNALIGLALLGGELYYIVRRKVWRALLWADTNSGQEALRAGRWMLASTYVVAGMSKILHGGWDWWMRSGPFVAQICKAQDEVLSTWAEPRLSESALAFGRFLAAHSGAAVPMLLTALLMELGAFFACTTRLRALLLGLGLVAFHHMSGWLMGLPFPTNTKMLVVLFIMPLSWLVTIAKSLGLRLPLEVPIVTPAPLRPAWTVLGHGSVLSLLFAVFLFLRGEWYPFSNFPMYAVLPPATFSLFATDLQGRPLPLETLGTDSRTLKKMINSELRKYKSTGQVRAMSQLTPAHWEAATARVIGRVRSGWKNQAVSETSFELFRKDYDDRPGHLQITSISIGRFTASGAVDRNPR